MPDEINNLPLHPLVVHAAVVLTPLAALAAIAFALVPRWRFTLRLPTLALAVAAFLSLWISKLSGKEFKDSDRFKGVTGVLKERIGTHQERADTLFLLAIVFVIVALGAVWLLGFARSKVPPMGQWLVSIVFIASAVSVLVYVALTGEAGSRAVWGS